MKQRSLRTITIDKQALELQHLTSESPELTDDVIQQFANTFRFIFCNPPYGQYLFYPSEGRPISPQEVFQTDEPYVKLDRLDGFDLNSFPRHPETDEQALFWQDPHITLERFQKKLRNNAQLTLLKQAESGSILGACLGYRASVKEVFESEEWQNPFHYSSHEDKAQFRDFNTFVSSIQAALSVHYPEIQLAADTIIFCQNCLFILPELQHSGVIFQMVHHFLANLPEHVLQLPAISEALNRSSIFHLLTRLGAISVPDALDHSNNCIMVVPLKHCHETLMNYLRFTQSLSI